MSAHGDEIRAARKRRQITQRELADEVGVNIRTVSSWESGAAVPRAKRDALNAALGLSGEQPEDNRVELSQMIREQMALNGWTYADVAERMPSSTARNVYNWATAANVPRKRMFRELEEALGWEHGAVQRILEAPITEIPSLSEVRDWKLVESGPKTRVSDIPTTDLLMELGVRWKLMERRLELAEERDEDAPSDNPGNVRNLFDLAAHNTSAGRNMEHLEDE